MCAYPFSGSALHYFLECSAEMKYIWVWAQKVTSVLSCVLHSNMDNLQRAFEEACDAEEAGKWTNVGLNELHALRNASFPLGNIEQVAEQWETHQLATKSSLTWSDIQSLCKVLQLMSDAEATEQTAVEKEQTSMISDSYERRQLAHGFRSDVFFLWLLLKQLKMPSTASRRLMMSAQCVNII